MRIFDPTWQETSAGFELAMPRLLLMDAITVAMALGFLGYTWLLDLPLVGWGCVAFILLMRSFGKLLRGQQVTAIQLTDTTYTLYTSGHRRILRQGPLTDISALQWGAHSGRYSQQLHLRLRVGNGAWYWLGLDLSESQLYPMHAALSEAILARLDDASKTRFELGSNTDA